MLQSFHTPYISNQTVAHKKKFAQKSLLIKYSAVGINLFVGWQLSVLFSDRNVIDRQRFHCFKFANSEGILKGVIHKGRSQEYHRTTAGPILLNSIQGTTNYDECQKWFWATDLQTNDSIDIPATPNNASFKSASIYYGLRRILIHLMCRGLHQQEVQDFFLTFLYN